MREQVNTLGRGPQHHAREKVSAMGWDRRVGKTVAGVLALTLALVACTAAKPDASNARSSAGDQVSTQTVPVSTSVDCVVATDLTTASDGVISAGPFKENHGYWLQKNGTKLWVKTSVDQKPTAATIRAQRLNATSQPIVQHRGTDTIAVLDGDATGSATGLFFPGSLRLPEPGTWKLTVTIGPDSGCFLIRV